MAEYLASIFGTEKDKVNCSFYFKIGACRHGDRCSRIHNKPTFSQTTCPQFADHSTAVDHLLHECLCALHHGIFFVPQNCDECIEF